MAKSKHEFLAREDVVNNVLDQMQASKSTKAMEERILNIESAHAVREVVFCDQCALHNSCTAEDTFMMLRIAEPFCCVGKKG